MQIRCIIQIFYSRVISAERLILWRTL